MPLVVMATDSAVPSGVGEHMLTLARAIRADHRVVVAFPPTPEGTIFLARAAGEGIATRTLDADESCASWLKDMAASILHVHAGIGWEGHGLAHAGWSAGVPVVRTEHLPYMLTDRAQIVEHRLAMGLVDRMVFVSQAAAESYRQAGFSGERTATVRNGMDPPQPTQSRAQIREALDLAETAQAVVTVARFTPQKDHRALIAAAALARQTLPDARFILVGEGPERAEAEALVSACGMSDLVRFLGERSDVANILLAADLFVLPSRFEGLPLALLEAMSAGLPVVATRIGGTREALGTDYPWLVDVGDTDQLAATIVHAFGDASLRAGLGARNRERFDRHFRADRMGRDMAAIYLSVLSEKVRAA